MAVLLAMSMLTAQTLIGCDQEVVCWPFYTQDPQQTTSPDEDQPPTGVEVLQDPEPVTPTYPPVRAVWLRVAQCESGGDWHINTGNSYYGGLQEDRQFWANYGNRAYARPDLAPMEEQVAAAERGLAVQGWSAWPRCSRILGLR